MKRFPTLKDDSAIETNKRIMEETSIEEADKIYKQSKCGFEISNGLISAFIIDN